MVHAVLDGYGTPAPTMPPPAAVGRPAAGEQRWPRSTRRSRNTRSASPRRRPSSRSRAASRTASRRTSPTPTRPRSSRRLFQILAQDLKQIGITLNVKQVPHSQWVNVFYVHHNPRAWGSRMSATGRCADQYPDPADALLCCIYSERKCPAPNSVQYGELQEPADGCAHCSAEQLGQNAAVRAAAIEQALKLAAVDLPYIPLLVPGLRHDGWLETRSTSTTSWSPWYVYQHWADYITAK